MPITDGMLALWQGQDASDSHAGRHLTVVGSPIHSPGLIGDAFEGGAGSWQIPNADAGAFSPGTGNYTVAFQIKIDAAESNTDGLFEFGNPTNTEAGLAIHISGGNNILALFSDGVTKVSKFFSLSLAGGWHSVVMEYDRSGNMTLYVDDVSQGTQDISSYSSADIQPSTDLMVSSSTATATNSLEMAAVGVWNRLLGSTDRATYHNSGNGFYYYQSAGKREVFYPLDTPSDTRGQVWADLDVVSTVAYAAGLVAGGGNCLDLSASGYLSGNHAVFEHVRDEAFSIDGWIQPDTIGSNYGLAGQTNSSYSLQLLSSGRVRFRVNTSGGAKILDHTDVLVAGTEYYIEAGHDPDNDEIYITINRGTPQTLSTSGDAPLPDDAAFSLGSIGSSQQYDGKLDEFRFTRGALVSSTDADAAYASGAGAPLKTELELDYDNSSAKKVYIQGYASKVGGSGTHTGHPLLILDDVLKTNNINMFDSGHADAATIGSLRFSEDEAGATMLPGHVPIFETNATPANGKLEAYTRRSTNDGGSDSGNGVYVWWIPGSIKTQPPRTHVYGRNAVQSASYGLTMLGGGYEDETSNGNDATATNTTLSTDVPYGYLESIAFNGTSSRLNIPDDDSLDLADGQSLTLLTWMKTNGDTGGFQGLMSKRDNLTHNYGAFFQTPGDADTFHANFHNVEFRGVTMDFDPNFSVDTWMPVLVEFEDVGTDYTIRVYNGTTLVNSATTSFEPLANTRDLIVGATRTASSTYAEFMDGFQKGIRVIAEILSADVKTTIVNNESDNAAFWNGQWVYTDGDGDGQGANGVTLTPADLSVTSQLDQTTISQNHVLSPVDASVTSQLDEATIAQNHVLSPVDASVTASLDQTTIAQNHVLSPADTSVVSQLDQTSVIEVGDDYTLSPADLSVTAQLDQTAITQNHVLSPADASVTSTLDQTTIVQNHVLSPADLSVISQLDQTVAFPPSTVSRATVALGASYTGSVSLSDF